MKSVAEIFVHRNTFIYADKKAAVTKRKNRATRLQLQKTILPIPFMPAITNLISIIKIRIFISLAK